MHFYHLLVRSPYRGITHGRFCECKTHHCWSQRLIQWGRVEIPCSHNGSPTIPCNPLHRTLSWPKSSLYSVLGLLQCNICDLSSNSQLSAHRTHTKSKLAKRLGPISSFPSSKRCSFFYFLQIEDLICYSACCNCRQLVITEHIA